MKISSRSLW